MKQKRKTKIIATTGPASVSSFVLNQFIKAGVDILRFNLKHGTMSGHELLIDKARSEAKKQDKLVQILVDIPTPSFPEGVGLAVKKKAEYIALSHVKQADEIEEFRRFAMESKLSAKVIAKIETEEALNNFNSILGKTDVIMVARGDLGKAIPIEKVPFVQKEIIQACKKSGKMVIIATEMLLSMISNEEPTRAEVSDVANAVLEGCDVVMLSEETAIGKYPPKAVEVMKKIIHEAESWEKFGHVDILSDTGSDFKFGV
jgi:pyruvate kinase